MLFDSWNALIRTLTVGAIVYVAAVVVLRIGGKRTLAKWNAFDLVVTVAFGSVLASALLSTRTAALQAVLAFSLLVVLQFAVTRLSVASVRIERLVKARPRLLLYRGRLLTDALRVERVTEAEVYAAVREGGMGGLDQAGAVVLETDGSLSVIPVDKLGSGGALEDVLGAEVTR